jgi:hypothetical protein
MKLCQGGSLIGSKQPCRQLVSRFSILVRAANLRRVRREQRVEGVA